MATKKKEGKKRGEAPVVNTVIEDGEPKPGELPVFTSAMPVEEKPVEVEEKPVEVKEKPAPTQRTGLLRITARQYVQAKGIRWERAAGFLHWATQTLGASHLLTVPEWTKVHEGFCKLPVGRK